MKAQHDREGEKEKREGRRRTKEARRGRRNQWEREERKGEGDEVGRRGQMRGRMIRDKDDRGEEKGGTERGKKIASKQKCMNLHN